MGYRKICLFAFLIMTQVVGCSYKKPATFIESPTPATFTPTPFTVQTEETPLFTPSPSPSPFPSPSPLPPFPPYPSPLPTAPGTLLGYSAGCPNPEGLKFVREFSKKEALEVLREFSSEDLEKRLQVTDPSVWPLLFPIGKPSEGGPLVLAEGNLAEPKPARESPYADLLANACGKKILDYSWWVEVCPGSPPPPEFELCPPGIRLHFFFINREGRWLIWGFG
jgi:hypothetical protein